MRAITVLNHRVLVLLKLRQAESRGGIIIPDIAQEAEEWGEVMAVGPDCEHTVQGDEVLVLRHLGTHFVEGNRDYIIIDEEKILAKKDSELALSEVSG